MTPRSSQKSPQYPPGPHVGNLVKHKIYVTSPGYDDIGAVLTSMRISFEPFRGEFDCAILFLNCGTSDHVDSGELANFVEGGGCLYASDHADLLVSAAFPGLFKFDGHVGRPAQILAEVLDPELREIIGNQITLTFDAGAWAILRDCAGEPILTEVMAAGPSRRPLMVFVEHERGSIFYTCFHNRAQATEHERRLLQLLILKQIGTTSHVSLEQAGRSVGIKVAEIKKEFRIR